MKNRALFIDRDGIFNALVPWGKGGALCAPRHWGEVTFLTGLDELATFKELGFKLVLITNQPDIERETTERRFVEELNRFYQVRYSLDAVYYCPFASDAHPWKKPNPGMLLQASQDLGIDLARSYFLGDTERDVIAARRAGCRDVLWNRPYNQNVTSSHRINSLEDLAKVIRSPKN